MAKKENYRAHSNGITAEIPKVCNVMSFGRGRDTVVTNSSERGIVSEEIALGLKIKAEAGGRGER